PSRRPWATWGREPPNLGEFSDVPTTGTRVCSSRLNGATHSLASSRRREEQKSSMPRFLVKRTFPDGLQIPPTEEGARIWRTVVANNSDDLDTWIQSYVSENKVQAYCVYDAPSPEAIRRAARRNNLPVDKITEVQILAPISTASKELSHAHKQARHIHRRRFHQRHIARRWRRSRHRSRLEPWVNPGATP